MRIGVDARIDRTGLGRYTQLLLSELAALDGDMEYVAFVRREAYDDPQAVDAAVERRLADIAWYSVAEQLRLPSLIRAAGVDLMHFPHFNVPLAYSGPYVVTVHDLTHALRGELQTLGDPATSSWRAAAYRAVLRRAVARARRIITVSEATKRAIVERLGVEPARISVTHEGVDPGLLRTPPLAASWSVLEGPFFLYVGSGHPHKNLHRLVEAFGDLREREDAPLRLVIAGELGRYRGELEQVVSRRGLEQRILLLGPVSEAELAALYRAALALVLVSLSEGFGLPGLEAMAFGTPVVAARIPALVEVYGRGAHFVDPTDVAAITGALRLVKDDMPTRETLVREGRIQAVRFSWRRTAEETRSIYLEALAAG